MGSIVQNGKFSAAAGAVVSAEKMVDLPRWANRQYHNPMTYFVLTKIIAVR